MMEKAINSNAIEDTIGMPVSKNGRSIKITMRPAVLSVSDHLFRTKFPLFCTLFSDTVFIAVLISGLLFGLVQESTASPLRASGEDAKVIYSGVWTANSPKFSRDPHLLEKHFHYQTIEISVPMIGAYTFTSKSPINTYGYIYDNNFNTGDPILNLIAQDDDSDGKGQFKITTFLHPNHKYILVATTNSPEVTGEFSIISSGPTAVNIRSIAADITTIYSGTLSSSSQVFQRPDGYADDYHYFHALQVSVSTSGTYVFTSDSDMDTVGYFYNSPFDPSNPLINLVTENDDSGDIDLQFRIEVYLHSGQTYVLVVTTHWDLETGPFYVSASGPATTGLISIIPSTSRPSITLSTPPTVSSSYSSELLSSSEVFHRPNGDIDEYYYFDAIQVSVPTAGTYVFTSNSDMDTVGYFYNSPFDPSNPSANLIMEDDDDGDMLLQFRIEVYLESGRTYVLVVTTHWNEETGPFSVSASGPATVGLTSIVPSTSRPIITSTMPTVLSSYSSTLMSSSQIFYRPDGHKDKYYYLQAIQVSISTAGTYVFTSNSNIDTMGYFYDSPFDPFNPLANLITDDDDGGNNFQFRIQVYLESGRTYVLVVTTHSGYVTGNFSVSAVGPASADLMTITASTSRPIITQATTPSVSSSYGSALTFNSPIFYRPDGNTDYYYHFHAVQATVSTAGTYIFTSKSDIDTRGYFYQTSFDPSDPTVNLITEDDDSAPLLQFRIQVYLQPGRTYILVVTTHREHAIGNFSILVTGLAPVDLMPITASTSRPLTTQSTPLPVSSSFAGALSSSSQIFYRPGSLTSDYHYFQALQVAVSAPGIYVFRSISTIDTRGYFYQTSFDPSNATANLITDDDDGGGQLQFRIQVYLQPGRTYVLVVTTHRQHVMGNFSITAGGPAYASLTSITPSTSRPITPVVTTPATYSSFLGALSTNSQIFYRPQSHTNDYHYFQAIQVSVSTAGTYIFTSNSSIDTRGYFYRTSFDPSNGTVNLIADNDDGAGQLQFRIQVNLEAGQTYILVVTTYKEYITGSFSISAAGPALVGLTSITPSTSRPITIPTTTPSVPSSYAGALSSDGLSFSRPGDTTQRQFFFQAIRVSVSTAGTYTLRSNSTIDTRGYFYNTTFNPYHPAANLITENDDSGGQFQFLIEVYLQSEQTYILVVTTHKENITGSFTVLTAGPASLGLVSITPPTTTTTTTPSTAPFTPSYYSSILSSISSIFHRPNGDSNSYYYEAIEVTASKDGSYFIESNSYIDTMGYLYDTSFDPLNPSLNLIASDDNSGTAAQFLMDVVLQSGRKYILVVTTFRASVMGSFWISTRGPASVTLTITMMPITSTITNNPSYSTQAALDTTTKSSATIETSAITTIIMCMMIMSALQIFQRHFF